MHKNNFPSAKGRGADLLELSAHEIEEVVSGRKKFRKAPNTVEKQNWKAKLGIGSEEKKITPTNSTKQV